MGQNGNAQVKRDLEVVCPKCANAAQRVETVLQEKQYGNMVAVTVMARIFTHIAQNGNRVECREAIKGEWVHTLVGMDEIQKVREIAAGMMSKWGDTKLLRFL